VSIDSIFDPGRRIEQLEQALAARDATLEAVKRYADDRSYHAGRKNNTVSSWRIASDLDAILAQPDDEAASE
jgi:hypothetical protein